MSATAPYWLDAPYEPRAPLADDVEVDAVVVGAGVGGLSCARRLARHGMDTLVLERGTVAGGASGRNGGFLLAGVAAFHVDARERLGAERARAIYQRTLDTQQEVYELAEELGAGDAVRRVGLLRASDSEEEAEHVRRHAEALRADGFPAQLVGRDQLPAALRRSFFNGCLTENDGVLHPARWIRALAAAAERAGARICEGTPVRGPVCAPHEAELLAGGRTVRARHVIVASDGGLPALVPRYEGRVRARRLHMVATEPLRERVLERPLYSRWGFEYAQQAPGGQVLAGGFSDVDGEASYTDSNEGSPAVWERIEAWLGEALGVHAQITHRWVGTVGYTDDGLPYAGAVPEQRGLYVLGGYSGHGNVPGYLAGKEVADLVAGEPGEPVLSAGSARE
ncbi:MAG TPA: FAD-dependent oxidoreductase [Thermoleophilaceae bacterium]|nr:FAD-dependent oxidoreductase [Thermoleophilaceae bacterium]